MNFFDIAYNYSFMIDNVVIRQLPIMSRMAGLSLRSFEILFKKNFIWLFWDFDLVNNCTETRTLIGGKYKVKVEGEHLSKKVVVKLPKGKLINTGIDKQQWEMDIDVNLFKQSHKVSESWRTMRYNGIPTLLVDWK